MIGMAKKKPTPERARDRGEVKLLAAEISPHLVDLVDTFARTDRRTKRAVIEMALEEFFTRKGLWPPSAPEKG